MKWFRRNKRTGSRLALFALALQFVLSFGHFHIDGAQAAALIQSPAAIVHELGLAPGQTAQTQQQPSGHDDERPSREPCAICTVMSMANQLAFATPTILPLPDTSTLHLLVPGPRSVGPTSPWTDFRSRAPPVS